MRILQAGCAVDGKVYISGGQQVKYDENCYDDLFDIVLKGDEAYTKLIRPIGARPPGRYSHVITPLATAYLVLIGGEGQASDQEEENKEQEGPTVALSDVWLFDRMRLNWLKVEPRNPIFKPRSSFTCE